jgi:cysteine synthase B
LLKLEGNNPAGSVKDRPALSMITRAELRGQIKPGDTLIEATSGNTGIALAMAAAIKGYKMILIMPDNSSAERKAAMTAYGAELILVTQEEGMEGARDLAERMAAEGRGKVLDQFANGDNPEAHYTTTGPEIWRQTQGTITHFVSSMGTTGTIMGVRATSKSRIPSADHRPAADGRLGHSRHPPLARRVPAEDLQRDARGPHRRHGPARSRGHHPSPGPRRRHLLRRVLRRCRGGMLRLSKEVENAVIVAIICDRGDRYLSTGIFDAPN